MTDNPNNFATLQQTWNRKFDLMATPDWNPYPKLSQPVENFDLLAGKTNAISCSGCDQYANLGATYSPLLPSGPATGNVRMAFAPSKLAMQTRLFNNQMVPSMTVVNMNRENFMAPGGCCVGKKFQDLSQTWNIQNPYTL